jgi:hypothetical protein
MAKSPTVARKAPRRNAAGPAPAREWRWLTDVAMVLAVALAGARMLMAEPITRSLGNPLPGTVGAPLGPGPATGLVLDLLCWLPAFAVLLRWVMDSRYTLRSTGGFLVMGMLGLWAVASMAWSANRFSAIVGAFHLLSAMILLWSAAQIVRSWIHLRCVAGLCAALLLALVVKGYDDHFVEQPMMRANWESEKAQVMRENNWAENSFDLKQFELRVLGGQLMGFSQSPNTYAGLLVLLGTVAAGIFLDWAHGASGFGKIAWGVGILAIAGVIGPLIHFTQCRAAYATPVLSAGCLAFIGWKQRWLAEHAKAAFFATAAAIVAGFAAIASFGIVRGNLIHSSLTFRWWYWIGSARIVRAHPLLGVGWGNFGPSYLGVRLPIASEEIVDPHNFIIRFFTELGVIGGAMLLVWLVWTAWKMTAGADSDDATPANGAGGWSWWVLTPPIVAIVINLLASVDFSQASAFIVSELTNRVYWLAAMAVGMGLALLRREPAARGQIVLGLEPAPALWAVRGMLVGLGFFLVHNLIEFGIFEPGPMLLVALLAGSVLGLRLRAGAYDPGLPGKGYAGYSARRIAVLSAAACGWIAAAVALVAPVVGAEGSAEHADDLIRSSRPAEAQAALESAATQCPYNAEYLLRAARAALMRRSPDVAEAMALSRRATAVDPLFVDSYLMRAHLELLPPASPASVETAIADYRRALAIDPNNVQMHLELSNLLTKIGQEADARREFETALKLNHALERGDPKRLSTNEIEQSTPIPRSPEP